MKTKVLIAAMFTSVVLNAALAEVYRPEKRWRGFNLLGMFVKNSSMSPGCFEARDFREIHELGFNFVRLPLDYRFWIKDDNWDLIDPVALAPLDQAVRFGQQYNIHVMINFHRAPGYTVAKPSEELNVFKDAEALRICAKHWGMIAQRYQGVPAEDLSFNLFNEPVATAQEYAKVVAVLVREIRGYNPRRLIICDGLAYGKEIVPELFQYSVGQATRGYSPGGISHYRAPWAGNPTAPPAWPPSGAVSPLYGPIKREHSKPLLIDGLPACQMSIDPGRVSGNVTFEVIAGNKTLATLPLVPAQSEGWSNVEFREAWNIFQADCETILCVDIPANAGRVSINIIKGDWAAIDRITFKSLTGQEAVLSFASVWYGSNPVLNFKGFECHTPFIAAGAKGGIDWLNHNVMGPWLKATRSGQFVMVGEFGSYKYTPHEIVLEWMEDYLKIWKSADMGWALWNFSGSFGIIDSGRADVQYEDFHGRQLDRKMLDLLSRY